MLIITFAIILIFLGGLSAIMRLRQLKRMSRLVNETASFEKAIEQKLSGYTFGTALLDSYHEFIRHLTGNNNKNVIIKHTAIIVFATIASIYINNSYVGISHWIFAPVSSILTVYILFISSQKRTRVAFEVGFSEALNIVTSAVSAGNSVMQGIAQCGEKIDGIVGDEFRQVSLRLDIGEDIQTVLMDSYQRLHYREYYFFVIAILLNVKGGGQVKEVMSKLSQMVSNARIMERKKMAKTSETRATTKILMAIPIGIFFMLQKLSPENIDILLHDPIGKLVLYYIIASEVTGFLIIWWMMNKI